MLNRYGRERLLYRISRSAHRERFVLKGATLFESWTGKAYRPTRDVDLLGFGANNVADLVRTFKEICAVRVEDDGLVFLPQSIRGEEIREPQDYPGVRLKLLAILDAAEIDLQVDIGFGDAVNPDPELTTLSTLLDFPAPSIRAYPKETVVAEKYEAMVRFGIANSRMKDFYDILILAREFDFEGDPLSVAIKRTFDCRETALPVDEPIALSGEFAADAAKRRQWSAFVGKVGDLHISKELGPVVDNIRAFVWPAAKAAAQSLVLKKRWKAGGPWT